MEALVQLIVTVVQYVWPFRLVHQWEVGLFFIFGRIYWVVPPGLYPVIPWFMDVKAMSVAEDPIHIPRQDVTLKDGTLLSFEATAVTKVVDPRKAHTIVDHYDSSTKILLASMLAEQFMEIEPARIHNPRRRENLFDKVTEAIAKEAAEFGVEVSKVRFPSFVLNPRVFRLLTDHMADAITHVPGAT